jgi:hypothetical protein
VHAAPGALLASADDPLALPDVRVLVAHRTAGFLVRIEGHDAATAEEI